MPDTFPLVTVNRDNLINFRSVPDTRYVNERSVTEVDNTALSLFKSDRSVLEFLANLVVTNYASLQAISVLVPDEVYLNYSSLLTQLENITNTTAGRLVNDTTRAAFNLSAITQPFYDQIAQQQVELNGILNTYNATLIAFSGRIVNVSSVLELLNESLANAQYWQDQLLAAETNWSNSLLAFAGNVSYQLRNRGNFFTDMLYGLGNALEDAANGVVNLGEDGVDLITDVARKIYEVGKKASESFFSALGSPFGIFSMISSFVAYILLCCIITGAGYLCYKKRKALKKLVAEKKKDATPAPAATPVVKPTPAPAPTAKVAPTKGSTDTVVDVDERARLLPYSRQTVRSPAKQQQQALFEVGDDDDFYDD